MPASISVLLSILIFLQFSCERLDTAHGLRTKLDDAVNRHASIDERIVDWGAPAGKNVLSDGRIVYTWNRPWTGHHVNYGVPGGQAYSAQHLCTIVITASSDNIIEAYNYRDC